MQENLFLLRGKRKDVKNLVQSLRSAVLLQPASAFAKNVEDIDLMLLLPSILAFAGAVEAHQFVFHMRTRTSQIKSSWQKPPEERRDETPDEISSEIARRWEEDWKAGLIHDELDPLVERRLHEMCEREEISRSATALLSAGVSSAWTAFECVATDTWVAGVNSCPSKLGRRAVANLPHEQEGLTTKQVSIKLLAARDFDLRSCLGSVLQPAFDFSSLNGIRKAYVSTFGESAEFVEALDGADLKLLHAMRNLIVHRAGTVDEMFLNTTGLDYEIGKQLPLKPEMVNNLINASINAGRGILSAVDNWISENPT